MFFRIGDAIDTEQKVCSHERPLNRAELDYRTVDCRQHLQSASWRQLTFSEAAVQK
jgi:hypothetical protein